MECLYIPEITQERFRERIGDKARAKRIPVSGAIEPTLRCNLQCIHCYIPTNYRARRELTYEQICQILDEIAEEGCLWLLFTGGEPFVRDDFLDIYTYAKKKGMIITIFTNGTLITPEIADYLAECPPFVVKITLYGMTQETYERITGVRGSYKRCLQGIEMLMERKIPLELRTVVMAKNFHELGAMKRYAEELGVDFAFDTSIRPRLDGSLEPCGERIPAKEVIALDLTDERRTEKWRAECRDFLRAPNSKRLYLCSAGVTSFHTDPSGRLNLCVWARLPGYDLAKGSFREGWYDVVPQVRAVEAQSDDYRCGRCDKVSLCGRCPAWSELENGNPEVPVDYICRITHLRAETFGQGAQNISN